MIAYLTVAAAVAGYLAWHNSTPERRRRWLARMNAPTHDALDPADTAPYDAADGRGGDHALDGHDGHGGPYDVGDQQR